MSNTAADQADSRSMEYDIALTLLSLQSGNHLPAPAQNEPPKPDVIVAPVAAATTASASPSEDTEDADLLINCVISAEVEVETSPSTSDIQQSVSPKLDDQQNDDSSGAGTSTSPVKDYPIRYLESPRSPSPFQEETGNRNLIKTTREVGTQTDNSFMNDSHNNNMTSDIDVNLVLERVKTLEEFNSNCKCKSKRLDTVVIPTTSSNIKEHDYDKPENDSDSDATMVIEEYTPSLPSSSHSKSRSRKPTHDKKSSTGERNSEQRLPLSDVNTKANKMVPIGEGNARVPSRTMKQINWASYTHATRKLLTAVFTRDVLASHSLTGKRSPAFPNKPAKKRLNPVLVNDIVLTVVERCQVSESIVRTSITTKCADESKMLRTKQKLTTSKTLTKSKKKIKEGRKQYRENIPPYSDY